MVNEVAPDSENFATLIDTAFRLSNALIMKRDNLVHDLGLTSARWQVLDAIHRSAPVAMASQVARLLGLSRQGVQRIVHDLERLGMLTSQQDPHDKRGHTIALSKKGIDALVEAGRRQVEWGNSFKARDGAEGKNEAAAMQRALGSVLGATLPAPRGAEGLAQGTSAASAIQGTPKPVRAFENVQAHILGQIRSGQLQTGSKLPAERELAASLGVGRSAVREALRSLEISGVLRFERGAQGGAFVRESGPDGIAASIRAMLTLGRLPLTDLLEVRASLLGQCARLGTDRATAEDFDRLDRNIDELEFRIATIHDQMASIAPATDFYRLAARAAHNPLMVLLVDAMADLVGEMLASLHHWPRVDAVAISARRQMVAAMRDGRADDAEQVIRQHSRDTNQLLLEYEKSLD